MISKPLKYHININIMPVIIKAMPTIFLPVGFYFFMHSSEMNVNMVAKELANKFVYCSPYFPSKLAYTTEPNWFTPNATRNSFYFATDRTEFGL